MTAIGADPYILAMSDVLFPHDKSDKAFLDALSRAWGVLDRTERNPAKDLSDIEVILRNPALFDAYQKKFKGHGAKPPR